MWWPPFKTSRLLMMKHQNMDIQKMLPKRYRLSLVPTTQTQHTAHCLLPVTKQLLTLEIWRESSNSQTNGQASLCYGLSIYVKLINCLCENVWSFCVCTIHKRSGEELGKQFNVYPKDSTPQWLLSYHWKKQLHWETWVWTRNVSWFEMLWTPLSDSPAQQ